MGLNFIGLDELVIKIYTCENNLSMNHLKNILENNGIACLIRNESLGSTAGELPPIVAWPELWINNASQEDEAKRLISDHTSEPDESLEDWLCEQCGETNEAQFGMCWNCSSCDDFIA